MTISWQVTATARVEKRLAAVINKCSPSSSLSAALETSLLVGGKRLRPIMLLAVAENDRRNSPMALDAACAVECLHCYSLVHDDLPCMDNAKMRRGRLSCHKAHTEPVALLAGDGLLTLAFQILAESGLPVTAVTALARAAGSEGMVGGQALDISNNITNETDLADMHQRKTGRLFHCALQLGLMCRQENPQRLQKFGDHFGLLYQIINDIEGAQKDRRNGKITYVTLLGKKLASRRAQEALDAATASLDGSVPRLQNILTMLQNKL